MKKVMTNFFKKALVCLGVFSLVLSSCGDYDDDITALKDKNVVSDKSITDLKAALEAQKTALETALASQNTALEALIAASAKEVEILEAAVVAQAAAHASLKEELVAMISANASKEDVAALELRIKATEDMLLSQKAELVALIDGKASQEDVDLIEETIETLNGLISKIAKESAKAEDLTALQLRVTTLEDAQWTAEAVEEIVESYNFLDADAVNALFANNEDLNVVVNALIVAATSELAAQADANKLAIEGVSKKVTALEIAMKSKDEELAAAIVTASNVSAQALKTALESYVTITKLTDDLTKLDSKLTKEIEKLAASLLWEMQKVSSISFPQLYSQNYALIRTGSKLTSDRTFDGVTYKKNEYLAVGNRIAIPVMINPNGIAPTNGTWAIRGVKEVYTMFPVTFQATANHLTPDVKSASENFLHTLNVNYNGRVPALETSLNQAIQLTQTDALGQKHVVMTTYDLNISVRALMTVTATSGTGYNDKNANLGTTKTLEVIDGSNNANAGFYKTYFKKVNMALGENKKFKNSITSTTDELKAGIISVSESPIVNNIYVLENAVLELDAVSMDYNGNADVATKVRIYYTQPIDYAAAAISNKTVDIANGGDDVIYDLEALFASISQADNNLILNRAWDPQIVVRKADGTDIFNDGKSIVYNFGTKEAKITVPATADAGEYYVTITFNDYMGTGGNTGIETPGKREFKAKLTVTKPNFDGVITPISHWWTNEILTVKIPEVGNADGSLTVDLAKAFKITDPSATVEVTGTTYSFSKVLAANKIVDVKGANAGDPVTKQSPIGLSVAVGGSEFKWNVNEPTVPANGKVGAQEAYLDLGSEVYTFTVKVDLSSGASVERNFKIQFVNPIKESKLAYVTSAHPDQTVLTSTGSEQFVNLFELLTMKDVYNQELITTTWAAGKSSSEYSDLAIDRFPQVLIEGSIGTATLPSATPVDNSLAGTTVFRILESDGTLVVLNALAKIEVGTTNVSGAGITWLATAATSEVATIKVVAVTTTGYGVVQSSPITLTLNPAE